MVHLFMLAWLLQLESEFWSASKTLKSLAEGGYFESQTKWPPILQAMIGEGQEMLT